MQCCKNSKIIQFAWKTKNKLSIQIPLSQTNDHYNEIVSDINVLKMPSKLSQVN